MYIRVTEISVIIGRKYFEVTYTSTNSAPNTNTNWFTKKNGSSCGIMFLLSCSYTCKLLYMVSRAIMVHCYRIGGCYSLFLFIGLYDRFKKVVKKGGEYNYCKTMIVLATYYKSGKEWEIPKLILDLMLLVHLS